MIQEPHLPSSDERFVAAISHFFGFIIALKAWLSHKEKSRFIRFQAIQAMVFDLPASVITVLIVGYMAGLILGVLALGIGDIVLVGMQNNPTAEPIRTTIVLMTTTPFLIPCIIIPFLGIFFKARLIATIQTFQGEDFRYPWLSSLIKRSLPGEKNVI